MLSEARVSYHHNYIVDIIMSEIVSARDPLKLHITYRMLREGEHELTAYRNTFLTQ